MISCRYTIVTLRGRTAFSISLRGPPFKSSALLGRSKNWMNFVLTTTFSAKELWCTKGRPSSLSKRIRIRKSHLTSLLKSCWFSEFLTCVIEIHIRFSLKISKRDFQCRIWACFRVHTSSLTSMIKWTRKKNWQPSWIRSKMIPCLMSQVKDRLHLENQALPEGSWPRKKTVFWQNSQTCLPARKIPRPRPNLQTKPSQIRRKRLQETKTRTILLLMKMHSTVAT